MNSDTCLSYFGESVYIVQFTPTSAHMVYLDNTYKKKKIDKSSHKFLYDCYPGQVNNIPRQNKNFSA